MKFKFEYTASGTPQQDLYAEMDFKTLAGMSRAMMNKGNILRSICYKLFGEATKRAIKLDIIVLLDINWAKKTCVKHYAS